MLRFPLDGLLDENACYEFLLHTLHPDGLHCPQGHALPSDQAPHRRRRAAIPDYRCRQCGAVFNLFTGTLWWKTRYHCSTIVQILRGVAQGIPTQHLADELGINRTHLLERRHQIHALVATHFSPYGAVARLGHRKRRTLPECGRERAHTRRSARPTAPPCQPGARPRDLGHRSPSDSGRGRTGQRPDPLAPLRTQ